MAYVRRYYMLLLLVTLLVEVQNSSTDETSEESRQARATGRNVKLYTGYKPEPVHCIGEGFQADPKNCGIFYRCSKSGKGKFTVFKFECAPGTVYDPDIEVCNYPRNTKRVECGGLSNPSLDNNDINEIHEVHQELSLPISTKVPLYTERTTPKLNVENIYDPSIKNRTRTSTKTQDSNEAASSTNLQMTTVATHEVSEIENTFTTSGLILSLSPISPMTTNRQTSYSSSTAPSKNKPILQNNLCTTDGFVGDEENCHKFYRCVGNQIGGFTRYEFSCTDSTVWDEDIQACNHPWAVKRNRCGKSGINTDFTKDLDIVNQSTTSTNNVNDSYRHSNSHKKNQQQLTSGSKVTKTYTSVPDQSELEDQLQNVYGNRIHKLIDSYSNQGQNVISYENKVVQTQIPLDSSSQTSQTLLNESTTMKSNSTSFYYSEEQYTTYKNIEYSNECNQSGFISDYNDCKKFYRCVDNGKGGYTKHEFLCGEGTLWDQSLETCNHAWAVKNCGSKLSSHDTEIAPSMSTVTSTQSYITSKKTTSNYIPTLEETYQNNQDTGYVNHNPNTFTTTTAQPLVTTSVSTLQANNNECKSSGLIEDVTNCKIFYRCVDNGDNTFIRYEFTCGEGTVWDSSIQSCNHAWAVDNCGRYGITTTGEVTTQYIPTQDQTINNSSYTLQYINSSSTTIHKTTEGTTTNTLENDKMCTQSGFKGDDKDCRKFYRCVDNGDGTYKRYEFLCGEGTVWDSKIISCNHASAVEKCGWINDTLDNSFLSSSEHSTSETIKENGSTQNINYYDESTKSSISTEESFNSTTITTTAKSSETNGNCKSEGFFGNPNNCKKFYRCVDNGKGNYNKYEFVCGDDTIWNDKITACDHESSDNKCLTSSIYYPQYTTEYHQIHDLDYSSTNTVHHEERSTQKSQTTSNEYQCVLEGFHGDPYDCKKFYRCVTNNEGGFLKYDFSCGDGTIWIQEIQSCDHDKEITNCSLENEISKHQGDSQHSNTLSNPVYHTSTTQTVLTSDDNSKNNTVSTSTECSSEGYYGNKNDCTKFYRCVENENGGFTKYEFSCGEGTAWDENIKGCNHIHLVETCETSNTASNNETDEEIHTSTMATTNEQDLNSISNENSLSEEDECDEEGYFGDTSDCKLFYRCVNNGKDGFTKYDFTCGDGTIWDQDITACNHPQDVTNPSCESDIEKNSTTDSSITTNAGTISSVTQPSTTQSSTTQSSTTQSSASTTQNGEQLSNNTQEETSKKPVNNNFTCTEAGFFPNPYDCKKFYRCVDWDGDGSKFSIFHFDCGEGTIWDPELQTCNYEESVYPPRNCSGALSQTDSTENGSSTTETTTTQEPTGQQTTQQTTTSSSQTKTQQTTTTEQTTTHQTTTEKPVTTEQTTTKLPTTTTTQESTSSQQTTSEQTTTSQQPAITSTQTTTHQSTTTDKTTSQESTTTEQTTSEHTTTSQQPATTTIQTTTQQSTTTDKTTSQESTTTEQTTSEHTTTSQQPLTTTSQTTTLKEQSTTIEETTTQQPVSTTESRSTTSEQITQTSTTEQITENQVTTTESITIDGSASTTTESSNETSTTKEEMTTEGTSTGVQKCPETDEDQYLFVCPTSFRRHPKYCNQFYQCTEEDDTNDPKIAVFTCPNNTIYDESKIQCVEEDKAEKSCEGEISSRRRVKRLGLHNKEPIVVTSDSYSCTTTGHVPFEKNSECSPAFMKCEKSKSRKLRGLVYQCPQNYIYWSISRRCERRENVRDCKRTINNWNGRSEIPIEKHNVAW